MYAVGLNFSASATQSVTYRRPRAAAEPALPVLLADLDGHHFGGAFRMRDQLPLSPDRPPDGKRSRRDLEDRKQAWVGVEGEDVHRTAARFKITLFDGSDVQV